MSSDLKLGAARRCLAVLSQVRILPFACYDRSLNSSKTVTFLNIAHPTRLLLFVSLRVAQSSDRFVYEDVQNF
jgi:hypothetical protein